jgi:hypothetical protein
VSQPTPYDRQASFTTIQQEFPTDPLPGDDVDAELNAVKQTLDEILNNLALIQRDDGELANDSVGLDQLSAEVTIGFDAPAHWAAATDYDEFDAVFYAQKFYICTVAHTSSSAFITDADNWDEIADFTQIGDYWYATSTTSQAIGTGSKSFTIEADRFYRVGDYLQIYYDATNYMLGLVTSYSGTALTVDVEVAEGSGTYAVWTFHLSGRPGDQAQSTLDAQAAALEAAGYASAASAASVAALAAEVDAEAAQILAEAAQAAAEAAQAAAEATQGTSVTTYGAIGDGTTPADTAIADCITAEDTIVFPAGEYRIDNDMTWPASKVYVFRAGAQLKVDSGETVTVNGRFMSELLNSTIFTGVGTVLGIREVYPEWWGAANDGTTPSAAAFQAAEDCMEASYTSDGPAPCLYLDAGNYLFEATVDCTPDSAGKIRWKGQGGSGVTQIIGKASGFTGTEVIWLHSFAGSVSLHFEGFRVIPETPSSGPAIGIRIGDTSLGDFITGGYSESCKFEDVNVYEFAYCWSLTNIRLCKFERCGGWVQTVTNGRALYIFSDATSGSPQDSYVGDLNFDTCQFVAATDTATGALCLDIASSNEGYIAGIRFPACILYIGPSNLTATVDSTLQDIWFTSGWQYDNLDGEGFTLATNTGGNINNINFVDGYMVSSQVNAGRAVNITTLGGSRVPTGVRIERNRIAQFTNDVIEIAGSKMCRVVGNNFIDCDNGDCVAFTGGTGIIIKDNIVLQTDGASTVATVVNHVGSSDYYVIDGNISNGFAGAVISDASPGANRYVPAGGNI